MFTTHPKTKALGAAILLACAASLAHATNGNNGNGNGGCGNGQQTNGCGTPGPQGPKGDTGATGATGAQGVAGTNGTNGADGKTGATGATGATGSTGATGATGAQGLQGVQGVAGKDAVFPADYAKQSDITSARNEARAGISAAMAVAALPQPTVPGASMVSMGAATYRGETGYALGVSHLTGGNKFVLKGAVTGDARGGFGAAIGAGMQF